MLKLSDIRKDYVIGDTTVKALRGVSLEFRQSEFVSILGPSGCGKTTLLNIIGGLDRYTSGDLNINGKSTKNFKDSDWDTYRNHSIGFVFQSYNLIPHQSVLANVELALTLTGVRKAERRKRAISVLEKVGLGDQINKKPNQMSGGQMQRVAIARALVNDPDILLADEPTGALDTETSIQIMDLIKEISKDRLVIMVTHNPELAEKYSSRIVRLLDGQIVGDSNPYTSETETDSGVKVKKPSMSFFTAMSLSLTNLLTKKGRTFLTAFAGSIGIIGIALILSLSNGIQNYINQVQEDTLASYPITIMAEETDMSSLISSLSSVRESNDDTVHDDAVYSSSVMYELINAMMNSEVKTNNLVDFKKFLEDTENNGLKEYVTSIHYSYNASINAYVKNGDGKYVKADAMALFSQFRGASSSQTRLMSMSSSFSSYDVWTEFIPGEKNSQGEYTDYVSEVEKNSYELVYGKWPEAFDEVVLVIGKNNEISDLAMYSLGLISPEEMQSTMISAVKGELVDPQQIRLEYADACNISFKLIVNTDYYSDSDGDGVWDDISGDDKIFDMVVSNGLDVKICGVVRTTGDKASTGGIGYTAALTEYIINKTGESELLKQQKLPENENRDLLTGLPFSIEDDLTDSYKAEKLDTFLSEGADSDLLDMYLNIMTEPSDDYLDSAVEQYMSFFKDRESIEKAIADNYASESNMSEEMISSYLESYSDEELVDMVRENLRESVAASFTSGEKNRIMNELNAVSDEELETYVSMISAQILSKTSELEYICYTYSQKTALPAEVIYAYLMTLDSDSVSSIFHDLAKETALEYIESNRLGGTSEDRAAEKGAALLKEYCSDLSVAEKAKLYDLYIPEAVSGSTLKDRLRKLGDIDLASPSMINIYTSSFESKDMIADIISDYNDRVEEEDKISYTDYVALLMSSITTIINAISYVLIAFVGISLVVSSIMIGIITYISVLERIKEIGILRAVGAAKRDISRVFNSETLIVGFTAGLIGIVFTVLICIPANIILRAVTGISTLSAELPPFAGIILVLISMVLTLISGLIPSRVAANKDPVIALRSE